MGLRINTNISSLMAQRHLASATRELQDSYRKLSSGLRVQSASDDAAALAISERMRSQVRALEAARRNANDGISLAQTAEGSLDEINSILVRLRELGTQAANGTTGSSDKAALDSEFQGLLSEIERIALTSEYGNVNLLDGSTTTIKLQVGIGIADGVDTVDLTLGSALSTALGLTGLSIDGAASGASIGYAITQVNGAIDTVTALRGRLGAIANRLEYTVENLDSMAQHITSAESRIRDVDVAAETAKLTRAQILQQVATAVLAQANVQPQVALQLLQ